MLHLRIAVLLLLLPGGLPHAAPWDKPSFREPFIDGVEAMIDSMRRNPPTEDGERWYRNPWRDELVTPFPSDDPWLDGLPYGLKEDSPFFRISPAAKIRGRWLGQYGDGLWVKGGWIRFYNGDDYRDGRLIIRNGKLYVGIEATRQVLIFEFAVEDDLLALRDKYDRTYLYQRYDENNSSDDESGSDDE